ncbi:glycosyltransferase family 4 protein [Streptomyces sp. TLI_171]|uniref:glycosyltransferase family 4 protein n=1 Tax=Streptomyces sp. TLI_171 TaxID=1938859 RepID=UPI000C17D51A|nr:glycosyltransferase family 4 protein [Streptomyces sp. TLI_171]RKE21820.1 glycosyltransferase involved in cell wall biosynthesis [Streptomyces sp. TLI_171]
MRILLAQNLIHLPSHGGANRSNRLLMERLAARGHDCTVVGPLSGALATVDGGAEQAVAALTGRGATVVEDGPEAVVYTYRGVTVHAVRGASRLPGRIRSVAAELRPDRTLVPGDDPGHVVLSAALAATPDRVVYLVHTIQQLPFGPGAFHPSAAGTRMVRRAAGLVAVSEAARAYVAEHAGLRARVVRPQVYGDGPFAVAGRFGRGAVTMVNPCAYKGISIFLGLADALPEGSFLAVVTWGADRAERAELARRANVEVVPPVDDIDEVLARTGVLLMPSLWDETFGYTCVEAMLRGVPVLASAVGGLVEAKLGVPGSLPVRPVTAYRREPGAARPAPVVAAQELGPWQEALTALLTDRAHYERQAADSRAAALAFVAGLDPDEFERYLAEPLPAPAPALDPGPEPRPHPMTGTETGAGAGTETGTARNPLSPDRAAALRLLAARRAAARGRAAVPATHAAEERPPC